MVQQITVHTMMKSVSTLSQASHASKIGDVIILSVVYCVVLSSRVSYLLSVCLLGYWMEIKEVNEPGNLLIPGDWYGT